MFCDVKMHFPQLLKAHVLMVAIWGILFIYCNEKVPYSSGRLYRGKKGVMFQIS